MNSHPTPVRVAVALASIGMVLLVLPACTGIPPAVGQSVTSVRGTVAELHTVHVQNTRVLADVARSRESALQEVDSAMRRVYQGQLEAAIAASKAQVLDEFDRRAADLLGVGLQAELEEQTFRSFDQAEHARQQKLAVALRAEGANPDDPGIKERAWAAQRDFDAIRSARNQVTARVCIARAAALTRARNEFLAMIDREYAALDPGAVVAAAVQPADTAAALATFNRQIDDRLALLDASYNSIDQALSDVSTYVDSKSMFMAFTGHAVKGAAGAVIEDFKQGQLGAAALSDILAKTSPGFVARLKEIEGRMKPAAGQAATAAAKSVATPAAPETTTATGSNT